jgi:hypothetical protein
MSMARKAKCAREDAGTEVNVKHGSFMVGVWREERSGANDIILVDRVFFNEWNKALAWQLMPANEGAEKIVPICCGANFCTATPSVKDASVKPEHDSPPSPVEGVGCGFESHQPILCRDRGGAFRCAARQLLYNVR